LLLHRIRDGVHSRSFDALINKLRKTQRLTRN
jgi:hypothetical protein